MTALVLALLATASPLREAGPLSQRTANYRIQVRLDPVRHTLDGKEQIDWHNNAGAPTSELWFHLYLNAFKNQTTAMMRPPEHGLEGRKPAPEQWGAIDVTSLECDGQKLALELREDGTVARVALPHPLPAGQAIRCDLAFTAKLPEIVARSGYAGDFHMVTQWFPKVGVWNGREWKCHVYCASCEFFADFGVYDVDITVPRRFVVGATGLLTSSEDHGDERTDRYHAEDVHDFAWAASPAFRERVEVMDRRNGLPGVTVRLLYQPQHEWFASEHMRLLDDTLRDYGDWFGPYPWATLTVIDVPDDATEAAMEYPTLIGTETPSSPLLPRGYAQYVTIHELGHNWFQGMLASNEAEEPWLDEGLNEYASDVVLERAAGRSMAPGLSPWMTERLAWTSIDDGGDTLGHPSWAYPSHRAYEAASYQSTATLLYSLERAYGRERVLAALGFYARRYRFQHPTTLGCIAALSESLGVDLRPLVLQLIDGDIWDDEVTGIAEHQPKPDAPWESSVLVHRKGSLRYPIELVVRFDDGTEKHETWDGAERWKRFSYTGKARIWSAEIDPAQAWLLDIDLLNNGWQREPARLPARRTASGIGFWLQSIWQALGF